MKGGCVKFCRSDSKVLSCHAKQKVWFITQLGQFTVKFFCLALNLFLCECGECQTSTLIQNTKVVC